MLTVALTIVIAVVFYMLIFSKTKQNSYKTHIDVKQSPLIMKTSESPRIEVPFIMFNSIKLEHTFPLPSGTFITENLYIYSGKVEILYENTRIGILKENDITFNCFDLLGLNLKIQKRAISGLLVSRLPSSTNSYVNIKYLEKACLEPALRLCNAHNLMVTLETLKTTNFDDFILNILKIRNYKPETCTIMSDFDLLDKLIYVESGSLNINGKVFPKGTIFGYFGIFLNYYRGFKVLKGVEGDVTVVKFVPYDKIKNIEFNKKMLRNIPKELIYIGATAQWHRVDAGFLLLKKDAKCDTVYMIEDAVVGIKECILDQPISHNCVVEKASDIIGIPKLTLDYLLMSIPLLYSMLTRRIFETAVSASKIVLIAPAAENCNSFIARLHRTLFSESIIVRNTNISEIMGRYAFQKVGELILYENLLKLKSKYKVVIIYLENEYSRLLSLISPICDLIFMVGPELIPNRFAKRNVEFIKLYERRLLPPKRSSKIKRWLFSRIFFDSDSGDTDSDKHTTKNVEIDPLDPEGNSIQKPASGVSTGSKLHRQKTSSEDNSENPRFRRIHHILSPKKSNFCYKDYERFGRYLLGQRFGLVLGGGGARGLAHIGVIQALEEENIPIDVVGGTSMGAYVGALYARGLDYVGLYSDAKRLSKTASSTWRLLADFSYPYVSLFSGKAFGNCLNSTFKKQQIQNFWLEYYCVTTNLKSLEENIHFNGPASTFIRASMSISGMFPPVFYNDDILCDGAYLNNVPTDVMRSLEVKNVISVDVGTSFNDKYDPYDSSSGLMLLFRSIFESKQYLSLTDMLYRLTFVSSSKKDKILKAESSLVIVPNLTGYRITDFNKFDEIVACGYESAKTQIKEWKSSGQIKEFKKRFRRFSI